MQENELAALRALAGEVVAEVTAFRAMECTATIRFKPTLNGGVPFDVGSPLYTTPPAPDREAVARAIMLSTDADPDVMIGTMGGLPKWVWDAADAVITALSAMPAATGEREAIVAWLRSKEQTFIGYSSKYLADCIERGDHLAAIGAKP